MSIFGTVKPSIFSTSDLSASAIDQTTIETTTAHGITANKFDRVLIRNSSGAFLQLFEIVSVLSTTRFTVAGVLNGTLAKVNLGYNLKYSLLDYNFVQEDQLNYRSVINGNKTNTHLGDYGNFTVRELLWRYTFNSWTASTRMSKLYNFYHTDVYFAPHTKPLMSGGVPITCYLKRFKPYMYGDKLAYDGLILEFDTNAYHDVSELL